MASGSNVMTRKRINRELEDCQKEDMGEMTLHPEEDLYNWKATIPGPEGSPYQGGVFELKITLGKDYPFSAPSVMFLTRIYHMNISDRGSVCIDILKTSWSPALTLYKVMLSLSSLLTDPNPKDPLVPQIASEFRRNRQKHDETAREWTRLYARPPPPPPMMAIPSVPATPYSQSTASGTSTARHMPAPFPVTTAKSQQAQSRRHKETNATLRPQRQRSPTEIIDLSDSPTATTQRRKRDRDSALEDAEVEEILSGAGSSGSESKRLRTDRHASSRPVEVDDVIVIDD